jgi:hypothetical protein
MGGAVDDVAAVLAREQRALEHLLFRLQHARVVLQSDDERFLALAADELAAAADTVRELEAARAAVVASTDAPTLRALAESAPEPYGSMLHEHHVALGRLAGEVGAMLESTQDLATDRLAELNGERAPEPRRARRRRRDADALDRALVAAGYESVLRASASLRLPSLVSFLA